ncbi:peroxisomal membrane protein PEX16-like [Mya arenaria]|uniref:peroxisomal membrane protein PEX16-like n=1 Tax=Mya arenaria TaxID=6604 RepID=UPI0022DFC396|nr:peroxisomal membrane protein PEX16-like [Mya arenaria]
MAASRTQTSKIDQFLQDLKGKYAKAVRNNPQTVAQAESAFRILSFLVAGRFENGDLISELIYSASNLLVFLNDNVFKAASKYGLSASALVEKLRSWLTVIEYSEVFLEMGARRKWGDKGAWIVITAIQIAKTVMRLFLLWKCNGGIETTPPIQPVDREILKTSDEHDNLEDAWDEEEANTGQEKTFKLKSSGREIRTMKAAGNSNVRTWGVPQNGVIPPETSVLSTKRKLLNQPSTRLIGVRRWAECLHVTRPMAHLLSMYIFGQDSWKPWLLAVGMDMTSQKLFGENKDLNIRERAEVKRRNLMLLYYLMRSPFYDQYTKTRLMTVFRFIAQYVPLTGLIMRPLMEYLPVWQRMYFYVWTT